MSETRWLDDRETVAWVPIAGLALFLRPHLDQAVKAHDLTFFDYVTLATLADADDRTLPMSVLARLANGSLSRMSHAAARLERKGLVARRRCAEDGRVTLVGLAAAGEALLEQAAPDHVESVREAVFDVLTLEEAETLAAISERIAERLSPGGPPNGRPEVVR
ncbi:MAG: MarR family transcriptional regulator [Actinomycetota bacterium]